MDIERLRHVKPECNGILQRKNNIWIKGFYKRLAAPKIKHQFFNTASLDLGKCDDFYVICWLKQLVAQ